MKFLLQIVNKFIIIFIWITNICINKIYNKWIFSYIIYIRSYMIKTLDQKSFISMDEYYVIHFYQVKPTIKYYLVKPLYVICT